MVEELELFSILKPKLQKVARYAKLIGPPYY
jgi:hypothetical protein